MRLFAISDLHLSFASDKPMDVFGEQWTDHFSRIRDDWHEKVTEEDVVVVAGDLSWAMDYAGALPDIEAICALPGYKVLIKGNHDYWHSSLKRTREMLFNHTYFLQNDAVQIGPYVFAGTRGWLQQGSDEFGADDEKIFVRETGRLKMSLDAAKKYEGTIIGISHYPPFSAERNESAFTKLYSNYGVQDVIYGHLHGAQIKKMDIGEVVVDNTKYHLTSCDFLDFQLKQIDES